MTTTPTNAPASSAVTSRSADVAAFVAGGLAAALGIALAELVAGLVEGAPSLVIAIGDTVIENQPPGAKELIVDLFGSNNKLALNVGIIITALGIALSELIAGLVVGAPSLVIAPQLWSVARGISGGWCVAF